MIHYDEVCREYRENTNPVTNGGFAFHNSNVFRYSHRSALDVAIDVIYLYFSEWMLIDPTSIILYDDHITRLPTAEFKYKSKIKPYFTECLEHFIEQLN